MNTEPPRAAPVESAPRSSRCRDERGAATAETAIVLPIVVVMVLVILVAGIGIGTQVSLESGARAAARELARGESEGEAIEAARRIAGDDTSVAIATDGDWVIVTTTRRLTTSGPLQSMSWQLEADAQARREPHLIQNAAGGGP